METAQGALSPHIPQFSIFLANKPGRLLELTNLLSSHHILIVALTILDTADSAIVRIIVSDPETTRAILQEHTLPYTETPLVAVELPHGAESLRDVLRALWQAECNIYFTYAFLITPDDKPILALHVEDQEIACDVLRRHQFRILSQDDISR
ncbi:MAG: acetolactate synthase [Methylacidiphilales bacterium]|nr:acetolactate synthase [Candidatus Methylacidiphilales bacterium]MDW8349862.1 acetolactate synthase [Verrucomicrobiae bacterium]